MGIYKLSFKNFKRRKLRSALTMLGIVIGVSTLILLLGAGTGLRSQMQDQVAGMMGDIVIVDSAAMVTMGMVAPGDAYLDENRVSRIKNMPQLYNFKEETQFTSAINGIPLMITGTNNWDWIEDQFDINGTPGMVIDRYLADRLRYEIGSKMKIEDRELTVTGIIDVGEGMGAGIIYLDIDKALPLNDNRMTSITASVRGNPETVKNEVENTINGTRAHTQADMSEEIDEMMQGVLLFIGAISSIALLVGIISIVNIMLVNVTERTREIGVLKAIGFTNREILGSILTESGLLGFLGALAGVIIAALLMKIFILLFGMEGMNIANMLPLWLIAGVIGGATILSVLAGLYPAWRASRLNVVEALRYE